MKWFAGNKAWRAEGLQETALSCWHKILSPNWHRAGHLQKGRGSPSSPWPSLKRRQWHHPAHLTGRWDSCHWLGDRGKHPSSTGLLSKLSLKQDAWSLLDGTSVIRRKITTAFTKLQTHSLLMMKQVFVSFFFCFFYCHHNQHQFNLLRVSPKCT